MGSRRRGSSFTRFFEDIVDDTKDFVDDLIDRAKDVEEDARDSVKKTVDDNDGDDDAQAREAAALRKQLAELKAKIDELTALQEKDAAGPSGP
jgi:polyhydroxyalkanoate synthesis regulator phasin